MVSIGVSAKPLVEVKIEIDLWKIFIKFGGDAICPGAGSIISWILEKLRKEAGMHFLISISGGIYIDGKVTINTSYPKETSGEVKATGKIQVVAEFKAWAKGGIGYLAFEGEVKADVTTSVTGGIKVDADKKGIFAAPIAEFAGVKATFVAIGTVKLGIFKRTLTYEGESRLVMPDEIKFEKQYIE